MKITDKEISELGFKQVNNSMCRLDNITIQNTTLIRGNNLVEKILSMKRGLNVCVDGRFYCQVDNIEQLKDVVKRKVNYIIRPVDRD